MVNLASTEAFLEVAPEHKSAGGVRGGARRERRRPSRRRCVTSTSPTSSASRTATSRRASRTSRRSTSTRREHQAPVRGDGRQDRADAAQDGARRRCSASAGSTSRAGTRPTSSATTTAWSSTRPARTRRRCSARAAVLDSIVGYHVENHQVHIHYYKPRGDSKEAWDNIDIVGFAGIPMQIKVNFLCSGLGARRAARHRSRPPARRRQARGRARHPAPALPLLQVAVPRRGRDRRSTTSSSRSSSSSSGLARRARSSRAPAPPLTRPCRRTGSTSWPRGASSRRTERARARFARVLFRVCCFASLRGQRGKRFASSGKRPSNQTSRLPPKLMT